MATFLRTLITSITITTVMCSNHKKQISKVTDANLASVWTSVFRDDEFSHQTVAKLQQLSEFGDVNSKAHLNLLELFGVIGEPNLRKSEYLSRELAADGISSANTVLGFLLKHNLSIIKNSETSLQDSSSNDLQDKTIIERDNESNYGREFEAMEHFLVAAAAGDPMAQIVIANYYHEKGRCLDSLEMYRKAAIHTLSTINESEITRFKYGPFIDEKDSDPIWPSLQELEYAEYEATRGDPEAAMQAAAVLLNDQIGLAYNPTKAIKYLEFAIESDISKAMIYMAHLHLDGIVDNPNLKYARELLEKALDLGDQAAHAGYSKFYLEGLSDVPKNLESAKKHLEKGVKAGHIDAMFHLGQLYATVLNDKVKAFQYWSVPASHGHVHAAWYSAEFYREMINPSTKIIGSNVSNISFFLCEASIPLYRNVAQAGNWRYLLYGGYQNFKDGRLDAAALKFMLLSDLGYGSAHVNLGRILQGNEITLYSSEKIMQQQEFDAWAKAANDSNSEGFLQLGHHLYYGTGGVAARNKLKAFEHYDKANILGNVEATFNVAYMYEWGDGINQNSNRASQLYTTAADTSEEAWLPCTLALIRLSAYTSINYTFNINLYRVDHYKLINSLKDVIICPEVILFAIILVLLVLRR